MPTTLTHMAIKDYASETERFADCIEQLKYDLAIAKSELDTATEAAKVVTSSDRAQAALRGKQAAVQAIEEDLDLLQGQYDDEIAKSSSSNELSNIEAVSQELTDIEYNTE